MNSLGALQCGGSGMFIPDPGSWFLPIPDPGSRIPDPKTATKERGEKKNYFNFEVLKKKIWPNFQRIIELFTQKIVTKLSKVWVQDPDPRSVIRKKPIPDPGSRGQKGTGSRIRIRNTGAVCRATGHNIVHSFARTKKPLASSSLSPFVVSKTTEEGNQSRVDVSG
jgi:hypothetical protein